MATSSDALGGKVVVCAALQRDAELTQAVLCAAGIPSYVCSAGAELLGAVEAAPELVLVSEEALSFDNIGLLSQVLVRQAPWSDIPFIVLATGGHSTDLTTSRFRNLERLGNVTVLERPVRALTVIAAVRSALRARRRQYEIREHLNALAQQAAELSRSNADLQQFAYVTSHDLREPLRTIASFSQLLAKKYVKNLDAEADQWIGFITGGVRRMEELIRDLLAYSRLSDEPRAASPVSVAEVLERAKDDLAFSIAESGVLIESGTLPTVTADEIELVQLFENLLSNAIKYRRNGTGARVTITAERNGAGWLFAVSDNGSGFEQKYAERIFDLFKRLHGKGVPGTGIGLTLCRKIVERNGGRIWAESEPGRGSTFWFTLPAEESAPL